jgi:hypothetical protein
MNTEGGGKKPNNRKEGETSKAETTERRNGDTPLGYLGRTALRREQCNVNAHCQATAL